MSVLNALSKLTDPGGLVKEVLDTALPKELHAISDAVALGIDLAVCGEMPPAALGAAKHALDLVKDFKDLPPYLANTLKPAAPDTNCGWQHEPLPPPPRAPGGWRGSPVGPLVATAPTISITNMNSNQGTATSTVAPLSPVPLTPAAPGGGDASALSKDAFMKLSDDDLMAALRDGKIPKEVEDSPRAMMQLQQRMNAITQMNQLMTSMLQAIHQMSMAIVQNVRV